MKISIITVCCNSAKYIRSAIESVRRQTYNNIEYIIIDGCSSDTTVDIIKSYEPLFDGRLKWISEKDEGIYDAMNKGIRMATGDIVGILNSDDLYIDTFVIEDIVKQIQNNDVNTLYGNIRFVKPDDIEKTIRIWNSSKFIPNSFRRGWHPPHPAFFVKKNVYDEYGTFDTSLDISADFELMLRFLEKYRVSTVYYDRFIVKMRLGGESTGSLKQIIHGNKNVLKAFEKNDIRVSFLYPFYRLIPKLFQFLK